MYSMRTSRRVAGEVGNHWWVHTTDGQPIVRVKDRCDQGLKRANSSDVKSWCRCTMKSTCVRSRCE